MMSRLPSAILFVCTQNAIRSPMAAAIMHKLAGHRAYIASAGVTAGDPDPFVGVVMDEVGLDLTRHRPHSFEDLEDSTFDVVITLSDEAKQRAEKLARTSAIAVEHWVITDPSTVTGSRDQILEAYRDVRETLTKRIQERFPVNT
jgi:protein-tyrosine-phosphatase